MKLYFRVLGRLAIVVGIILTLGSAYFVLWCVTNDARSGVVCSAYDFKIMAVGVLSGVVTLAAGVILARWLR